MYLIVSKKADIHITQYTHSSNGITANLDKDEAKKLSLTFNSHSSCRILPYLDGLYGLKVTRSGYWQNN